MAATDDDGPTTSTPAPGRGPRHLASGPVEPRVRSWTVPIVLLTLAVVTATFGLVAKARGGTAVTTSGPPQSVAPTSPTTASRGSIVETPAGGASTTGRGRAPTAPGVASGQTVSLAFAGDIHFERGLRTALDADPARPLAGVRPLLEPADLTIANLETAVTDRGTPVAGKEFTFRAPPTAFAALRAGGIDVVAMANNHALDFGAVGLDDTLAAAQTAGFPVIGIGKDEAAAYKPYETTIKGQRLAVIAATQVLDGDLVDAWTAGPTKAGLASAKRVDRLVEEVRSARTRSDTVVVYLHWGTEGETCPNADQPALVTTLAAAGADVIVGSHSHRLAGAGYQGPTFVAYGLGNFAFYSSGGAGTATGVLRLEVAGRATTGWRWEPARIVGQLPRALSGSEATKAQASFAALATCAKLTPTPG